MRVIVTDDHEAMSRTAADALAAAIAAKPDATVLVATGNTPMRLYEELADRRQRGQLDTSRLRAFQLDEYLGLAANDRRSLFGWMRRAFVEPLGIPAGQVVRLAGDAADPATACAAFDGAVAAAGGIEISILGLGPNGHLGFNEPPSAADAATRIVELTPESVESNGPYWGGTDEVPRRALTAGMNTLLAARQTLLVVSGAHKRNILDLAVTGPMTAEVPASFLQEAAGVTIFADRAAWGDRPVPDRGQDPRPDSGA